MNKNLISLGLLRNGKVYASKQLAIQGLTQASTNDGVAKLARYLDENNVIRTVVGFYADANEMEDSGGGTSSYTILDIDGSSADVQELREEIAAINLIIGDGIDGTTLTDAINDINDRIGSGFTEDYTIADALEELAEELEDALTISLTVAGEATSGYLKTYILSQGENEIGRIDIPKDLVVTSGSLVHGYWSGDTFTEDEEGTDTAIKLVIANQEEPVYINTKDLVDYYTAGDGIDIDNTHNTISIKYNAHSEEFLVVDEDGIRVEGVQAAIDKAIKNAELDGSNGISIASNKVKAVAASYSAPAIKNPISVDKDGIKFASMLDCGFFDDDTVVVNTAEDIAGIENPQDVDVFINSDAALNALSTKKTFKNVEVSNVEATNQINLSASESIIVDGMDVNGNKGSSNAFVLHSAPVVEISNASVANGSKPYNVFEQDATNAVDSFNASYVTVDNPSLKHNVFNIYKVENDALINITDSKFNLTVDNSNALRLANLSNATGVTVNFENIEWTYENSLTSSDWSWAGLIIYQPYSTDDGLNGNLDAMKTWTFNFKNCKYNGVKVTENNFGEHNQVFYLYNVGNDGSIKNPVTNDLVLNFD
jgi:hypothetical protein